MNILFYTEKAEKEGKRLKHLLSAVVSGELETHRTVKSLVGKLSSLAHKVRHLVLLISNKDELQEILTAGDIFVDLRIIIVLPNHDNFSIAEGHMLYPRFLTYLDHDFSEVATVLENMVAGKQKKARRKKDQLRHKTEKNSGELPLTLQQEK